MRSFLKNDRFSVICMVLNYILVQLVLHADRIDASVLEYPALNGSTSFPKWGGICDVGRKQSPIELNRDDAQMEFFEGWSPLVLLGHSHVQKQVLFSMENQAIKLTNFGVPMILKGGHLLFDHVVEAIYFHWPSEHVLEGTRHELECQIVCRNKYYSSLEKALTRVDGVVIVAVLFHISLKFNGGIANLIQYYDQMRTYEDQEDSIKMSEFNLSSLMPDIGHYFAYKGSLTTPPCSETVTWIVLRTTFPISKYQTKRFTLIESKQAYKILNNYRFTQKRYKRKVVYVSNVYFRSSSDKVCDLQVHAHTMTLLYFLLAFGKN